MTTTLEEYSWSTPVSRKKVVNGLTEEELVLLGYYTEEELEE